jgi:hypothetical protein
VTTLRCIARDGRVTELSYADLRCRTSRFANLLRELGVARGDRVFSLLGRVPELYVAALGTLKNVSVFSPLFPAFGPEPIRERLRLGDAKVLVTSPELYRRKIMPIRDTLPGLEHVLIVGEPPDDKTIGLTQALAASDDQFDIPATDPEELAADAGPVDIRSAMIRRPGRDVSLITYGGTLPKALAAAGQLSADGIDAEVIDLRSLRPLDDATIMASVARTHRAVIIDEGWRSGSLAAEVSARITEQAFYDLDAPVARVCSAEVPMPYPRHLEEAALPQPERIVAAAHEVVG